MKRLLPYLLVLALVLAAWWGFAKYVKWSGEWAVWEADTTRQFSQIEVDRLLKGQRDSLNRQSDSAAKHLIGIANRHSREVGRLSGVADSLLGVLDRSQTPSESLTTALHALDVHQAALGEALGEVVSLRGAYAAQSLTVTRLTLDNKLAWDHIDSLQALIRRVPKGCRLLLIPCPRLVGGVGVTYSGGKVVGGPSVAFGWSW